LIDWAMPGLNGIDTALRLLAQTRHDPPAIVMLGMASGERLHNEAPDLQVNSVLQKPVSYSTLHDHLVDLLVERVSATLPGTLDEVAEHALRLRHSGAHVLLAEDNLVNQEVATALLRLAGLRVDVAQTGHEAVDMASAHAYDLILMDMQMPELDGLQATRILRSHASTADVPIIAMTANAYAEDRIACLQAGMDDYVTKPVDPPVLYGVLARWLPQVERQPPAGANGEAADEGASQRSLG
ncbi:MAG: hypothetical protein JWP52_978, partial [Rhizobacter sp.]|nr:hypothetical protein [Rhizobacter sp.]